jgi:hypothetical protein
MDFGRNEHFLLLLLLRRAQRLLQYPFMPGATKSRAGRGQSAGREIPLWQREWVKPGRNAYIHLVMVPWFWMSRFVTTLALARSQLLRHFFHARTRKSRLRDSYKLRKLYRERERERETRGPFLEHRPGPGLVRADGLPISTIRTIDRGSH